MLHLVQSNKMELLLAELLRLLAHKTLGRQGAEIKESDLLSVLTPETVLVQSPGMAQWLKINIANTLQIAANIEFPLPSSYIWQLYRKVIATLPDESAFNKQHLTWKILQLLPELCDTALFQQINQYLTHGKQAAFDSGVPSLKAWHLAAKIADIYDQYLMYRPDWIEQWENGVDDIEGADVSLHPWQPQLWREIKSWSEALEEAPWHRANMHNTLVSALTGSEFKGPEALYVFGMSTIPLQQLEILRALAQKSEVYIFWFNPTQHFWADVVDTRQYQKQQLSLFDDIQGDDSDNGRKNSHRTAEGLQFREVGNPLLASWGKIGRDFHQHLTDIELQQHDLFQSPNSTSLLGWLQKDVFELAFRESRKPLAAEDLLTNTGQFPKHLIQPDDRSFEIHIAHSVLRELEILRDQICHWFQQNQVSSLNDIIVMMPDVASYAPLIDAVFSRPLTYGKSVGTLAWSNGIPYAISDRSQLQEDAIVESFIRLMSLHLSRLTLTEVFELISVPEIAASYELDDEALSTLREWCYGAGIRWGLNAEDKTRFELPQEEQNTWSFGIQRLMAGLARDGMESGDENTILPYDEVEGQFTPELGKILAFVEDLENLTEFCAKSHNLESKVEEALLVIDCFFLADSQQEYRIQQLRESISKLKAHTRQYTGEINQDTFVAVIKEQLNQSGVGQRFLAGKLNFCTLMPMRSIPFQHVCLLGMNEADYPRQTTPVSFDLMNTARPRKGDRSRRQDDRYLFLEALLSARQKLYVSYIGKSDRSNAPLAPSILLNELLQYCQQSVCFESHKEQDYLVAEADIKRHLITEHPLRPWDPSYFEAAAPRSYEQQHLEILQCSANDGDSAEFLIKGEGSATVAESQPDTENSDISLENLIRYFRNPVKSWFKQNWKTQFPSLEAGVKDEEPLFMNALDNHQLAAALLAEPDVNLALSHFKRAGQLPLANLRIPKEQELAARVEQVRLRINESIYGNAVRNDTEQATAMTFLQRWYGKTLFVNGHQIDLSGLLPFAGNGDLVLYRPGKLRAIDRLALWCSWCLFCSAHKTQSNGWFVAENKTVCHKALSSEVAMAQLEDLVNIMVSGVQQCFPFFPEAAMVWMESGNEEKTIAAYQGSSFARGEGQEAHNLRVFPELTLVWDEFTSLAERIYASMLEQESMS